MATLHTTFTVDQLAARLAEDVHAGRWHREPTPAMLADAYGTTRELAAEAVQRLKDEPKDELLELDAEGQRAMADLKWMHEQHLLGTFANFGGEYVGVYNLQLVGHDPSLKALRERMGREKSVPLDRLVTTYICDASGYIGSRPWRG